MIPKMSERKILLTIDSQALNGRHLEMCSRDNKKKVTSLNKELWHRGKTSKILYGFYFVTSFWNKPALGNQKSFNSLSRQTCFWGLGFETQENDPNRFCENHEWSSGKNGVLPKIRNFGSKKRRSSHQARGCKWPQKRLCASHRATSGPSNSVMDIREYTYLC